MTPGLSSPRMTVGLGRPTQLCLQRGDARLQRLIFLARQPRHVLDRLEFLALHDIEVAQDFFGLVAHEGIDLALDALGRPGRVVHQAANLVEKPITGLGHPSTLRSLNSANKTMAIPLPLFKASWFQIGAGSSRFPLYGHAG